MACPVCGARCVCKKRGAGGLCCGCHTHKSQRQFTRGEFDRWRSAHDLAPLTEDEWAHIETRRDTRLRKANPPLPFEDQAVTP